MPGTKEKIKDSCPGRFCDNGKPADRKISRGYELSGSIPSVWLSRSRGRSDRDAVYCEDNIGCRAGATRFAQGHSLITVDSHVVELLAPEISLSDCKASC